MPPALPSLLLGAFLKEPQGLHKQLDAERNNKNKWGSLRQGRERPLCLLPLSCLMLSRKGQGGACAPEREGISSSYGRLAGGGDGGLHAVPVFEKMSCRMRGLLVTMPEPRGRKSLREREEEELAMQPHAVTLQWGNLGWHTQKSWWGPPGYNTLQGL